MAEYITSNDIHDKLLSVTEYDIAEANIFIEDTAARMGVMPASIRMPLPFMLKRLAVCFACYNSCLAHIGTDATTTFDGGDRKDIYAQKLEFYKNELNEIQNKLTKADFIGDTVGVSSLSIGRA